MGEPLTYHPEEANAENLVTTFYRRAAKALPSGGLLIFDVIGLGEPSLAGRTWSSGDDWAVLVETTEDQTARTWSGTYMCFEASVTLTGVAMKSTGSIFLISRCHAISSVSTDLQPKFRHPMALSSSPPPS